jgi:hypothetical protein
VLLAEFLPRFHSRQLLSDSFAEYIRTAHVLDDHRARQWLEQDLVRDQELAAIESNDAERAVPRPSLYALRQCYHCAGRGYVRLDVDPSHPDFGKPHPCPACSMSARNPAEHCEKCATYEPMLEASPRCSKCGKNQAEFAGDSCGHPRWHDPNWKLPETLDPRDYADFLAEAMKSA